MPHSQSFNIYYLFSVKKWILLLKKIATQHMNKAFHFLHLTQHQMTGDLRLVDGAGSMMRRRDRRRGKERKGKEVVLRESSGWDWGGGRGMEEELLKGKG